MIETPQVFKAIQAQVNFCPKAVYYENPQGTDMQVSLEGRLIFQLSKLKRQHVYLDDAQKAKYKDFYCLSLHFADIERVFKLIAPALSPFQFVVGMDDDDYLPMFELNEISKLTEHLKNI